MAQTHIVLLQSVKNANQIRELLEERLACPAAKPAGVVMRSGKRGLCA